MASGADAGLRMTVRKKNKTDMQEMKRHVSVRPARKSDAADIARLVVMAWPVEAFLAHGHGQTVDDLIDLVADMAAREDTLYSYRNTVVAELAPGGAGADSTVMLAANRRAWMMIMAILCVVMVLLGIYHIFMLPSGKSQGNTEKRTARQVMAELGNVLLAFFRKSHIVYYLFFIVRHIEYIAEQS